MSQTGRLQREMKPLVRYNFVDMTAYVSTSDNGRDGMVRYALAVEQSTSQELVERQESGQHGAAMDEQIQSLDEGNHAIGCNWVYEKKEGTSSAGGVRFQLPNHVCSLKKIIKRVKSSFQTMVQEIWYIYEEMG